MLAAKSAGDLSLADGCFNASCDAWDSLVSVCNSANVPSSASILDVVFVVLAVFATTLSTALHNSSRPSFSTVVKDSKIPATSGAFQNRQRFCSKYGRSRPFLLAGGHNM